MPDIVLSREDAFIAFKTKLIKDKVISLLRWSIVHRIIVKLDDGLLYEANYSVGAYGGTLAQWEMEPTVTFRRVEKVTKTVVAYVLVP